MLANIWHCMISHANFFYCFVYCLISKHVLSDQKEQNNVVRVIVLVLPLWSIHTYSNTKVFQIKKKITICKSRIVWFKIYELLLVVNGGEMCVSQYFFLINSKIASGNVRCACNVELFSYNQCHISNISVISGEFKTAQ